MLTLGDLWSALTGSERARGGTADIGLDTVVIDSRLATPGSLFVALRGERHDGHEFVSDAFGRGAVAALVSRPVEGVPSLLTVEGRFPANLQTPVCLIVPDVLRALQDLSAYYRRQHPALRVIGVTGSVGKSSTKEAIAAVLGQRYRVLKSEGNYNNEIGLPLTLLQLDPGHERAVLEMGMYALGEIARLVEIGGPSVGVVTNVGPVHLERLGSIEAVAEAKSELARGLPPDGVLVLNGDDARVSAMADLTPARTVITYGMSEGCELRATEVRSRGLQGIEASLSYRGRVWPVRLPWPGRHNVYVALAAAAVGLAEGLTPEEILAGLGGLEGLGRLKVVPGPSGATILDDTYNASPASTLADLDLLAELPGRHIALLGDMLELGSEEEEGHRRVGRRAGELLDVLIAVGRRARWIAEEARRANPHLVVEMTEDRRAAATWLRPRLRAGDHVLVKGSRGMALEEAVSILREEEA
ncbi:MAG: UDP-N-acetylmuramoyl-tripeptide--D-alanyl-D-alanine ligase [Anaerolineae bacterium]|nr:UDP-N-acetylmuramoyl-tripeptide--D-alanyl-D-alanine ligase [Anaerolineae bacterium]